ncbi:MAG: hypothetical protein WCH99_08840 [Verrucomicrobiota bacterium]
MKKTLRSIFTVTAAAVLCLAAINVEAQAAGNTFALNGATLNPLTTNSYTAAATNQIFVNAFEYDYLPLGIWSVTSTPTNTTGVITIRAAKSVDGVTQEATPSQVWTLSVNSTNNNQIITNLYVRDCKGFFITSLENTNANAGATNLITIKPLYKYPKFGAVGTVTK